MITIFDYEPYRKLLKNRNVKQEEIIKLGIINRSNASSLRQNKPVRTDTLEKLCSYFHCQFNDLIQHYDEKKR